MLRMFLPIPLVGALLIGAVSQVAAEGPEFLEPYRTAAVERWEKDIQALEELDQSESDPEDGILFIGSSSIRLWKDIAEDMAPYQTIRRGYGGAKYSDLAIFAERLIQPHQYKALVVFVANDVSGKETDHSPDQVEQLVRHVVEVSHAHRPEAPVVLMEITPTRNRWHAWAKIRIINQRIREIALTTPNTYFVPTAGHFLLADGTPRESLFIKDLLHLNSQGYDLWAKLIRRRLDDILESSGN